MVMDAEMALEAVEMSKKIRYHPLERSNNACN
jgi:hypothetical protein